MITAVISLNVSKEEFDNNVNEIQTKFISAIAAAAGVSSSDVHISSVVERLNGGNRRRLLRSNHGIDIVTNVLGASKLHNVEDHIKNNGIGVKGHLWAENHQLVAKTLQDAAHQHSPPKSYK